MSKKNLQPKKIDQHVYNFLKQLSGEFRVMFDMLMELMVVFEKVEGREHFKGHLFGGFKKYLGEMELGRQDREEGYGRLQKVDYGVLEEYVGVFIDEGVKNKHINEILDKIDQYFCSSSLPLFKRALKLLHSLHLKPSKSTSQIIHHIKRHISTLKFSQILFYFPKQDKHSLSQLIHQLSLLRRKESDNFVVDIIKKYKLNYEEYPQILLNLERKGIGFNYREYSLYFCQDKFSQEMKYMAHLVELLVEGRRLETAKGLVNKYHLADHQILEGSIYALRKVEGKKIGNILRDNDSFGATQLRVLNSTKQDYLELMDFKIDESDVIWVDNNTKNFQKVTQTLLESKYIGFDVETSGGITGFQENTDEIIQIATESKVFIFDIQSLNNNHQFRELIERLFIEENEQVVIGHSCAGDLKAVHGLLRSNKMVKKIVDIQNIFKQEMKGRAGLKDIVEKVYEKRFSKYEQCSGWRNRPLRRAQIHYAALDAFVLIKLYKKEGLEGDSNEDERVE